MADLDCGTRQTTTENKAPKEVQVSNFGCTNCLWDCLECKAGALYKPKTALGQPSCVSYTYYD